MADLKKLFVLVPAGSGLDCAAASADGKLYFEEETLTIWAKGKAYGLSVELAGRIDKLVELIGAAEKAEDAETIIERLEALEAITVAEDEKVLTIGEDLVLSTTLDLAVVRHAGDNSGDAEEHEYIQLLGIDGALVAEVEVDQFVKDGMISSVEWKKDEEGKETSTLIITWNTDAGGTVTEVDMTKFIDTYKVAEGSENFLEIGGYEVAVKTGAIEDGATGLAVAGDVYEVTNELEENLAKIGTVLVGNGDTYMDDETAARYFKMESGDMEPSEVSALQDITDLRHAAESSESLLSEIGKALTGYGEAAIDEETAAKWMDMNSGEPELGKKSIFGSISALEDAIDEWDPWDTYVKEESPIL